jgi:hypothetical protein
MKILKKTTELGVSGKLTIHFRTIYFQNGIGLCLPTKTFAGI